jgi:hypothetical protein
MSSPACVTALSCGGVSPLFRYACDYSSALDTLDSLFLAFLLEYAPLQGERALDVAIFKELGWSGVLDVTMTSQVRYLHAVLRMPPHRPPRIALLSTQRGLYILNLRKSRSTQL